MRIDYMSKNYLDIGREIVSLFPDKAALTEKADSAEVIYSIPVGKQDMSVKVVLKERMAIISSTREYIYEIIENGRSAFNDSVIKRFGSLYQIYSSGNSISVTRRMVTDTQNEILQGVREYNEILQTVVSEFELNCVNFKLKASMDKYQQEYNPEQVYLEEEPQQEVAATHSMDAYQKESSAYCRKIFTGLARGKQLGKTPEGGQLFAYKARKGKMMVSIDPDASSLQFTYVVKAESDMEAYSIKANVAREYPDISIYYDTKRKELALTSFLVPDPYVPQGPGKCVRNLFDAYDSSLEFTKKTAVDGQTLNQNMNQLFSRQMQSMKRKEELLGQREENLNSTLNELEKSKKALEEREAEMKAEMQSLRDSVREKELELDKKSRELEEKERNLNGQSSSMDEEKAKYLLNIQELNTEIQRLQDRAVQGGSSEADLQEIQKLRGQLASAVSGRASMEKTLKTEIKDLRRKLEDVSGALRKKEEENATIKNDMVSQAEHYFDQDKLKYEKEIADLREAANLSGLEISLEKFMEYLKDKDEFTEVKVLHADDKEILAMDYKSLTIKVIFGDLLFVDVSRNVKSVKKNSLERLNNEITNTKFFVKGNEVFSRQYFGRRVSNEALYDIINGLISYFE